MQISLDIVCTIVALISILVTSAYSCNKIRGLSKEKKWREQKRRDMLKDGSLLPDVSSIYKAAVEIEENNKKYFVPDEYGDMTVLFDVTRMGNEQRFSQGFKGEPISNVSGLFYCVNIHFSKKAGESDTSTQRFVCEGKTLYWIGRSEDCNVVINDTNVSRRHAILRRIKDKLYIIDCGSTNGTSVNNKKIEKETVKAIGTGDVIRVGNTEFTVQLVPMK